MVAQEAIVIGYLPVPEEYSDVSIGPPCEGCPFGGKVTELSADNAVVEHILKPDKHSADVMLHFEQPEQPEIRTGLIALRVAKGETDEAAAQTAAHKALGALHICIEGHQGPLTGRDSGLFAGFVLRKTVHACGAFHQQRETRKGHPVL